MWRHQMPQIQDGTRNNGSHNNGDITQHEPDLSLGRELEHRAAKILELLAKLEISIQDLMSIAWEHEYERRDLLEHINDLNQLIKATVALMRPHESELSPQAVDALGRYFDEKILLEKAKNWELSYQ